MMIRLNLAGSVGCDPQPFFAGEFLGSTRAAENSLLSAVVIAGDVIGYLMCCAVPCPEFCPSGRDLLSTCGADFAQQMKSQIFGMSNQICRTGLWNLCMT